MGAAVTPGSTSSMRRRSTTWWSPEAVTATAHPKWSARLRCTSPHYRRRDRGRHLERRDLVVHLRAVVQVVVVGARRRGEEELDAVAAHVVVTRKQRRPSDRPHLAVRIGA